MIRRLRLDMCVCFDIHCAGSEAKETEMAANDRPTIASVLRYWMEKQDITPSKLARNAGLSRATIYVALDNRRVNAATLSGLATGLAREGPHQEPNPEVAAMISHELHLAAGYGAPAELSAQSETALPDLSTRLADLMGDPLAASRFVTVIREWRTLDDIDRLILMSVIEATAQRRVRIESQEGGLSRLHDADSYASSVENLASLLNRIQVGLHLSAAAEQPMILRILTAIAEGITPTEAPVPEIPARHDTEPIHKSPDSDFNHSRRGGRIRTIELTPTESDTQSRRRGGGRQLEL
jgi:hypothetical protein